MYSAVPRSMPVPWSRWPGTCVPRPRESCHHATTGTRAWHQEVDGCARLCAAGSRIGRRRRRAGDIRGAEGRQRPRGHLAQVLGQHRPVQHPAEVGRPVRPARRQPRPSPRQLHPRRRRAEVPGPAGERRKPPHLQQLHRRGGRVRHLPRGRHQQRHQRCDQ